MTKTATQEAEAFIKEVVGSAPAPYTDSVLSITYFASHLDSKYQLIERGEKAPKCTGCGTTSCELVRPHPEQPKEMSKITSKHPLKEKAIPTGWSHSRKIQEKHLLLAMHENLIKLGKLIESALNKGQ